MAPKVYHQSVMFGDCFSWFSQFEESKQVEDFSRQTPTVKQGGKQVICGTRDANLRKAIFR